MTRHQLSMLTLVFATFFVSVVGRAVLASETPAKPKSNRPNIIFLLTDDQRARTFSVAGHPTIKTPNLDKLANDGIRFTNAFVTNPICMPSRVTYLNGLYERVHGIGFSSKNSLSEQQWSKTYPALMRDDGYYTGFIGKIGIERYVFRGNAQAKFDFWRGHDGWARFVPGPVGNCQIYSDSKEDIITPIMGESVDRFLDTRPADKPFCLSVSFSAPHGSISGSMFPGEGGKRRMTHAANTSPRLKNHPMYGSLYRDKNIVIPDETATDPSGHIPTNILEQSGRKNCYSYNYTRKTCLEHHYRYYQLITGIDRVVGQLRESLEKHGLSDNTIIIYTSDHGLLMGEYGMGGKSLLYDLATRVPFLIYDPTQPDSKRGKTIDALVLNADVAPTILAYAGIEPPNAVQGKNLAELMNQPNIDWRKDIFLENLYNGRDNPLSEAIRTKRWKYIRYFKFKIPSQKSLSRGLYREQDVVFANRKPAFEQLFDLENDPCEKINLVSDKSHADILNQLRTRCQARSDDMAQQRKAYLERQK